MSGKPLNCVGTEDAVGKHDFQLSTDGEIVHGAGNVQSAEIVLTRRSPESQDRYYAEKISELVMTQKELAHVVAERDALKNAIETATIIRWSTNEAKGDWTDGAIFALDRVRTGLTETLAKLASGELRKLTA